MANKVNDSICVIWASLFSSEQVKYMLSHSHRQVKSLKSYTVFFRFPVTKKSSHERSYFWIVVDDQRYARFLMYSSDTTPPGSTTINLELNAGQIVMVENDHSTVIFCTEKPSGAILSWFTGHMIYPL